MDNCSFCNNKGYQESSTLRSNYNYPMITRCPNHSCPYINNYYETIRQRYSNNLEPGELVVPNNQTLKPNKPNPSSITVNVPENLIKEDSNKIAEYINTAIKKAFEQGYTAYDIDVPTKYHNLIDRKIVRDNLKLHKLGPFKDSQAPIGQPGTKGYQPGYINNVDPVRTHQDFSLAPGEKIVPQYTKPLVIQDIIDNIKGSVRTHQAQTEPSANQAPSNGSRQKVEMDTEYPNLPKALVSWANNMVKQDPNISFVLDTPFGPLAVSNLSVANRMMGIINEYIKHQEELTIADETNNVVVFPLGRALGFDS